MSDKKSVLLRIISCFIAAVMISGMTACLDGENASADDKNNKNADGTYFDNGETFCRGVWAADDGESRIGYYIFRDAENGEFSDAQYGIGVPFIVKTEKGSTQFSLGAAEFTEPVTVVNTGSGKRELTWTNEESDTTERLSSSPQHPASRVNSQGPTCFNRPCPQGHPTPAHPISHPLQPISCTCAMLHACVASTPHLLSVLGRSLQFLHIHFITSWEAKSRPSQAHGPQCLCLCSAPSLPGPGGNICTPVAAVSKKKEKKSSNFSHVVAINSYAYLQAFFEEFTYSLRF